MIMEGRPTCNLGDDFIDPITKRFMENKEKEEKRTKVSKGLYNLVNKAGDLVIYTAIALVTASAYVAKKCCDTYNRGQIFSSLENKALLDAGAEKIINLSLLGFYFITPSLKELS